MILVLFGVEFFQTTTTTPNIRYGTKYSRMDQVKFVENNLKKFEGVWSVLGKPYTFRFCKGCLPEVLLCSFSNTFSHMMLAEYK